MLNIIFLDLAVQKSWPEHTHTHTHTRTQIDHRLINRQINLTENITYPHKWMVIIITSGASGCEYDVCDPDIDSEID